MQENGRTDDPRPSDANLKDIEPGSDADATPAPEVGKTPPNPNGNEKDTLIKE
jgi:hypothetical protein